jgi:hypothetical protein
MASERAAVTAAYLEHLSDDDIEVLALEAGAGRRRSDQRTWLRYREAGLDDLLGCQGVFETVFGQGRERDPMLRVSPFLAFAVAVHRAALDLESATYVSEWMGINRRTPVFDVPRLREFASAPWRRFFLAELLASYTHVASGSVVVATRRGLRRQRFSELDPVRMAGLLEVVSEAERPGVLRRLGDLTLFLTGVFPDHVARNGFGPIDQARLTRAGRLATGPRPPGPGAERTLVPADGDAVTLLELLGRRWYNAAFRLVRAPVPGNVAVLGELPERFGDARRILGFLTDRYLFAQRNRWFGAGPG